MRDRIIFGDIAEFRNGLNYVKSDTGFRTKILGVGDFGKNHTLESSDHLKYVEISEAPKEDELLQEHDLVFVRSNGNKKLIGRCLVIRGLDEQVSHSGFTIRARITSSRFRPEFVSYLFKTDLIKKQLHRLSGGTNIANLSQDILKSLELLNADESLQLESVRVLDHGNRWQGAISNLITAKKEQKRGLMQLLLTGKKRFPEFGDEPWQEVRLKKHLVELNERNRADEIQRVLSVTNKKGFVLPEDRFAHRVASADVSNYKIVREGQFAYNPSRINVGSWAHLSEYDVGILSPMYVVFGVEGDGLLAGYLKHWLASYEAKERIKRSAQGSVRDSVSFASLCAIKIFLPPTSDEQNRIVQFFNMVDTEIDLLKKLRDAIGEQKRGLMQKLLTGEVRVKVDEKEVA